MRARLPAFAALALLVAGCVAPAAPVEPAEVPVQEVQIGDRPDPTFEAVETGSAAEADEAATLAAPPQLKVGEWWRIRSAPFNGEPVEYLRVIAAVQDAQYVVGMPHEGWFKEAVAYHSPAFGDVAADLSYMTHNVRFEPVRFPLTEGATWDTSFATVPVRAAVHVVDEAVAQIEFRTIAGEPEPTDTVMGPLMDLLMGDDFSDLVFLLTYDARQHEIVKFESAIIGYEVIEHGYGFEGWVTVPRGMETPIDQGPSLPAGHETATIPVAGGFNRLTMMHFTGGATPGVYRVRTVAPDGTEHVSEVLGAAAMTVQFFEASNPDGDWTLETLVAGMGGAYAMGIAYHQYDIHLPDGAKRADHSHKVIR
jgi:hypothetical protein